MKQETQTPKELAVEKFVADHLSKIDSPLQEKGVVVTILEGNSRAELPLIKPNKVHLCGTIKAPAQFYAKRKDLHDKNKCHVIFNKQVGVIVLIIDENFENDNYKIVGELKKNDELAKFEINSGKTFDPKDLLHILKFNRVHFSDKAENAKICAALLGFKAKVTQAFENVDDLRGDAKQGLETKIEHELQQSFMLNIPLFKGEKKNSFKVDICLQVRSGNVVVYLESVELKDLEMSMIDGIIDDQLSNFEEIVCIEQ